MVTTCIGDGEEPQPLTATVEWADQCLTFACPRGGAADPLVVSFDGEDTCLACGRVYRAETWTDLALRVDGSLLEEAD